MDPINDVPLLRIVEESADQIAFELDTRTIVVDDNGVPQGTLGDMINEAVNRNMNPVEERERIP